MKIYQVMIGRWASVYFDSMEKARQFQNQQSATMFVQINEIDVY